MFPDGSVMGDLSTAGRTRQTLQVRDPGLFATAPEVSPDRRELFEVRAERWLPDLRGGLAVLYPPDQVAALEQRLLAAAARAYTQRPDDLHRLDLARTLAPDWFQAPDRLGYAAYADRLGGDLAGVRRQIPYLKELGVTYLHLMPLLRARAGDSDGGYAVADYRAIRSDLGTVDDLEALARDLRAEGISLVLDLVLNHVAREHAWAVAARDGDEHHRGYFYVYPDRSDPDAYERTLPEVFPDFAPGNFTWEEDLRGWVWTTFNSFQWDVNWTNPDVLVEYVEIVLWLANLGVEVLRLDAIAFLWKRLGTNCQNQPEVHAIAQALRSLIRIACPAVLLKAEAIVSPDDLVHYLGSGRHHGKVSDLAYHNTLMVQIWSMLATRDVRLSVRALQELPRVPTTTAWICYARCHDDIGWAIDDGDAAAVGLNGWAHRSFLSDFYTGEFPGSFARGLVFQANPATGDRRVSGMTSSLAGLELARAGGDPAVVELAIRRILLAHAIVLGWGGIPVLWMGDEIALPPDPAWAAEPGHESDNRWSHRPPMDAKRQAERNDPDTVTGQIFAGMRHLATVRAGLTLLHAATQAEVLNASDSGVLPVLRRHPEGELLELFNVTDSWRPFPGHRLAELGLVAVVDVLSGDGIFPEQDGNVWLAPYRALWLISRPV
jgi:amylosucrase